LALLRRSRSGSCWPRTVSQFIACAHMAPLAPSHGQPIPWSGFGATGNTQTINHSMSDLPNPHTVSHAQRHPLQSFRPASDPSQPFTTLRFPHLVVTESHSVIPSLHHDGITCPVIMHWINHES
jgi:hypothetical protein